jgi:hypothetical protein
MSRKGEMENQNREREAGVFILLNGKVLETSF